MNDEGAWLVINNTNAYPTHSYLLSQSNYSAFLRVVPISHDGEVQPTDLQSVNMNEISLKSLHLVIACDSVVDKQNKKRNNNEG